MLCGMATTPGQRGGSHNIFDRRAKKLQRNRAAALSDSDVYDYLKEEVGYRVADRVFDISKKFSSVVDLGCGKGFVGRHLNDDVVEKMYACEISEGMLQAALLSDTVPTEKRVIDEENPDLQENSFDLVISSLSLHWVNDLPGTLDTIMKCLKNDGVFLASMFGGETLHELRCSLQLAELEREGGFAPHVSPLVEVRDIGSLLNQAGFTMLTIDSDEIMVRYPSMFELMWDLKGMGESNAAWNRKLHFHRDSLIAAAAIYQEMYGDETHIPATFQVFYLIGWKPDASQPKPLARGSGNMSLKDIYRLDEVIKEKDLKPHHIGTDKDTADR